MAPVLRGIFLASLSVSVLAIAACSTTGGNANMTNRSDATRVEAALERAAREAKASGNKEETIVLLEKLYERNPNDAGVATSFGQALREDEQLNRARQVLQPFAEGDKAYPDAVVELAMVQLSLGQYREAELTSRHAVELDNNSGRAYLALGTALDAQNYHEQAEVAFRRGIEKWKGDPAPIMNNLALNLASQNKLDQAIDMLRKAQEVSPGRVELERNMRIITTLKEDADDFIVKQEEEKQAAITKKAAPAAKVEVKEVEARPAEAKAVEVKQAEPKPVKKEAAKEVDQKDIDNKQLAKPVKATAKPAKAKTESVEVNTNARGSKQNFNTKNTGND